MNTVILRRYQAVLLIENARDGKPLVRRYCASVQIEDQHGSPMVQENTSDESIIDAIDMAIRFAVAKLFPLGRRLRHITLLSYRSEALPQPIEGEEPDFGRTARVEMTIKVGGHNHTVVAQGTDTLTVVAEKLVEVYSTHLAEDKISDHDAAVTLAS